MRQVSASLPHGHRGLALKADSHLEEKISASLGEVIVEMFLLSAGDPAECIAVTYVTGVEQIVYLQLEIDGTHPGRPIESIGGTQVIDQIGIY